MLGRDAVMGGVGYIAATIGEPGVIVHTGTAQKLALCELDGTRSARAEAFLQACNEAGIEAELSDDINRLIWQKFVFLAGLSAATTSMRQSIGPIRSSDTRLPARLDARSLGGRACGRCCIAGEPRRAARLSQAQPDMPW